MPRDFKTSDFRDLLIRDLRARVAELEQALAERCPGERLVPCIQLERERAREGGGPFQTRRNANNGEETNRPPIQRRGQ